MPATFDLSTRPLFPLLLLLLLLLAPVNLLAENGDSRGSALYAVHCASCHRQLTRTDIKDRPAKRIRSAINYFPVMFSLRSLKDDEVAAIAAVLATNPPPVTRR